jgi:transposase-like protein
MDQQDVTKSNQPQYYRFQLFQGQRNALGKLEKTKTVGMAYLKEGHDTYTIRLWTFLNDKFFLLMNKNDSSRFLVMSREANKNTQSKNKYFWNVIGNGKALSSQNCIELRFDLFEKPIYMNIFPEANVSSVLLPEDGIKAAA